MVTLLYRRREFGFISSETKIDFIRIRKSRESYVSCNRRSAGSQRQSRFDKQDATTAHSVDDSGGCSHRMLSMRNVVLQVQAGVSEKTGNKNYQNFESVQTVCTKAGNSRRAVTSGEWRFGRKTNIPRFSSPSRARPKRLRDCG